MRVFLTGGTGFIGSHVAVMLLDEGHDIVMFARNPDKVPGFVGHPHVEFVKGVMDDFDTIEAGLQGCDAAVHVALCWGNTATDMLMNETRPSVFICEAAAKAGVKSFMFTSSEQAFGDPRPFRGEDVIPRPHTYYSATKAATENYLMAIAKQYGMRANVVRPGYTFDNPAIEGAGPENNKTIPDLVARVKSGERIEMSPNNAVHATSARNVADVYRAILNSDVDREVYLAIDAQKIRLADIAQRAIELSDSGAELALTEERRDVEPDFDVSKIQRQFGLTLDSWPHMVERIEYCLRTG
jgi:UDP-glucose 4-epimerase